MLYMYALPGSGQVFLYCSIRLDSWRGVAGSKGGNKR